MYDKKIIYLDLPKRPIIWNGGSIKLCRGRRPAAGGAGTTLWIIIKSYRKVLVLMHVACVSSRAYKYRRPARLGCQHLKSFVVCFALGDDHDDEASSLHHLLVPTSPC